MKHYTIEEIKRDLPGISVKYQGQIIPGRIVGRQLDCAIVCAKKHGLPEAPYSWHAVCRAINNDLPLSID